MTMRLKMTRASFTTQSTLLIPLPDIPGKVVQVRRVQWGVEGNTASTVVGLRLYHNTDLSVTLAFADLPAQDLWCVLSFITLNDSLNPFMVYEPPYELVGTQRFDFLATGGTHTGVLTIAYTLRNERNRTLWNDLRSRTSHERQ